jgi:hypothetical protein
MSEQPLQVGELGVLQNLKRTVLNGHIAEVTGKLKRRILYSLTNPADSEICLAYKVRVTGFPQVSNRIEWCVKRHQLRRVADPDDLQHEKTESLVSQKRTQPRPARVPATYRRMGSAMRVGELLSKGSVDVRF